MSQEYTPLIPSPLGQAIAERVAREESDMRQRRAMLLEEKFSRDPETERTIAQNAAFIEVVLQEVHTPEELIELRLSAERDELESQMQWLHASEQSSKGAGGRSDTDAASSEAVRLLAAASDPLRRLNAELFVTTLLKELPVAQEIAAMDGVPIEEVYRNDAYHNVLMRKAYTPTDILKMHLAYVNAIVPSQVPPSMVQSILSQLHIESASEADIMNTPAFSDLAASAEKQVMAERMRVINRGIIKVHQYWGVNGLLKVEPAVIAEVQTLLDAAITPDSDSSS